MDRENSKLLERVSVAEVENALLLKRHSTSHASEFPDIPRGNYEDQIFAKARLEVIPELNNMEFVFDTVIEKARVKASETRLACDYDPATPQPNSEEGNQGSVDQLADSAQYDSAYGRGREGEDIGNMGGDDH